MDTNLNKQENDDGSWRTYLWASAWAAITWFAFPPVAIWPLGWIAVAPLVPLIWNARMEGRNPYRWIWTAGFFYWLATFYFIPIPHWALWGGWIVVSAYLACYTPMLVCSARTMVHRYKVPTAIAVPVCWVGWEWTRSVAFTGMGMVCQSHTQFKQPLAIQVADLSGAYTLTFALAFVGACVALVVLTRNRTRWNYAAFAGAMVAAVLGYGYFRMTEPIVNNEDGPKLTIGIIQGSIDTTFPDIEQEMMAIERKRLEQYRDLTRSALKEWPDLELIVWPESSFPAPNFLDSFDMTGYEPNVVLNLQTNPSRYWADSTGFGSLTSSPVPMLVGTSTYGNDENGNDLLFNSAALVGPNGFEDQIYHKNHLVMFGEYVPGRRLFPKLQEITPIGNGVTVGDGAKMLEVKGLYICPSVCFESTVPHLIRSHYNDLAGDGRKPDVLLNVTNDGWFYGTSCLDFHLACNVFRAVEMRTPMLVCANTGLSAEIDSNGQLLQTGPRRKTGTIRVQVEQIERGSPYRRMGDLLPILLAVVSVVSALFGMFARVGPEIDDSDAACFKVVETES